MACQPSPDLRSVQSTQGFAHAASRVPSGSGDMTLSGRAGRPRKPTELKVLAGNPGKRALPESPQGDKPVGIPGPPASLDKQGRAAWQHYWTHGRAWLAHTDAGLIERLCVLIDLRAQMENGIREEGLLHASDTTGRSSAHYLMNQLLAVYGHIAGLEREAGFTPRARADMGRTQGEADPAEEFLNRGNRRTG